MSNWNISPGERIRRAQVHAQFGGQTQGGISTSSTSSNIMIFADPVRSRDHGYDLFEGQQHDGTFHFTGQGQLGDMTLTGPNRRLLEAPANGDAIRLFLGAPPWATYVGAYTLDDPPFRWEQMPDRTGAQRKGIVFHLAPVDADPDLIPVVPEIHDLSSTEWEPRNSTAYSVNVTVAEQLAQREEFKLEARFGNWLRSRNHIVKTLHIRAGGRALNPDVFDETDQTIFEVKASASSEDVRMAIGQILDYARMAKKVNGIDAAAAILVPSRPSTDLVGLCADLKIAVWIPKRSEFVRITS
ncbi:hypothetical protein PP515_gp63 [Gordonia phage Sidious]|uniref:ScoMcrA-like SRA domain-containing protein n=1 Tax=Gordonia phage Sidious TaxID=2591118 RepID=A0A515MID0_9CAUD|nr:hypothetical protein PP515_gp63 [Gordonia phage Sidious]QDM56410.1 hypothetical protein SEA_SIDIOUS_63 [Gordonia phage Sidious]